MGLPVDFEVTDDQLELRRSVRGWLERSCPIQVVRAVAEGRDDGAAVWKGMVELGWQALTVAEEHGGVGLSTVELAMVMEELGRAVAPGPYLGTVTQFVAVLREAPARDAAGALLERVASGEVTGTLAAGGVPRRAGVVYRADRDGFVLEGTVRSVVDGADAAEIVVPAHDRAGDDGVGLFVVPRDAVRSAPLRALDPTRGLADITLEGVPVGPDRVLASPGTGAVPLRRALDEATVALAAETVGACQAAFDLTLDHVKVREQFGAPIGSFQAVKHTLADCFVALEKARATVEFAAMTVAEDDPRREVGPSLAKAAAGDCQRLVAGRSIQLHGGIGYTWEHDLHLYVKRAMADDALLGGAREHRRRLAAHALAPRIG